MHPTPVALVTGGSRGIGRGICQALARQGYAVAVNFAGNEGAARTTLELIGGNGIVCQADVGDAAARSRLVEAVLDRYGRIDVLINNAGIGSVGRRDLLEATEESWDRVLAVDLKGPYFLTQLVARAMIDRLGNLTRPAVVNVSSISAVTASVSRGDYCVAKAGLSMVTKLFAVRLAEHGIRVYEVRPGIIDTDMIGPVRARYVAQVEAGLTPIRRLGTPDDVGRAVALLVTGELPFSTGDVLNVDGGFHLRRL
jgi:3-oxoacyl-[acyl-carrier protein] reductase